ncbi:MAG: hypothetical protein QX193_05550 [Methylococcales bacterium]|nr:hypothetical protein [Methylococcales bacterium]
MIVFIHVTAANDGSNAEVDLSNELDGEVFEPLKDKAFFNHLYSKVTR